MPGMDGFEVLERLKGAPETCNIPVVIVTGQRLDHTARMRLGRNAAAILPKDVLAGAEALSVDFGPPLSIAPRYAGMPGNR